MAKYNLSGKAIYSNNGLKADMYYKSSSFFGDSANNILVLHHGVQVTCLTLNQEQLIGIHAS